MRVRRNVAAAEEKERLFEGPIILHYDRKLLLEIDCSKECADRVANVVTENV